MINYIRHDNEFYGIVKLVSGEEVMGSMIATNEDNCTMVYVCLTLCALPSLRLREMVSWVWQQDLSNG